MPIRGTIAERFARVESAFAADGFKVRSFSDGRGGLARWRERNGRIGVLAEHTTAVNTKTGKPKKALYVEGSNAEMGYLIGLMAETDVSAMTTSYLDNVVFAFFDLKAVTEAGGGILGRLKELVVRLIIEDSQLMAPDIPIEYVEELQGILEGCQAAVTDTRVEWSRLWALNFGVDCVLSHVYTGRLFEETGVTPAMLRAPLACNAFFLTGRAAEGGKTFFGRDFMFPTADVFQDAACLIVYNPEDREGRQRHAFVSQTAPGFIGSMVALNARGVAIGVNMTASPFCDPARPGFNSLSLCRDCGQYCSSAPEAVERITRAQRGVAWIYPVGDDLGRASIVEAGKKTRDGESFPYFTHVPPFFQRRLPHRLFIERMRRKYGNPRPLSGLIARSYDYPYPMEYITDWNRGLYEAFNASVGMKVVDFIMDLIGAIGDLFAGRLQNMWKSLGEEIRELLEGARYDAQAFGERGFINGHWKNANCPGPFYFAPQRETRDDVLIATNHFLSPEMRMASMNEWTAMIASSNLNDFQWRYDRLNELILDAIAASPEGIGDSRAWAIINFLNPDPQCGTPEYYNPDGAVPWREIQVHGSVTLCELSTRTLKSLFGCYGDEPVTIRLMNYCQA